MPSGGGNRRVEQGLASFRHAELVSASQTEPSPEFLQLASSLRILPSPRGRGDIVMFPLLWEREQLFRVHSTP